MKFSIFGQLFSAGVGKFPLPRFWRAILPRRKPSGWALGALLALSGSFNASLALACTAPANTGACPYRAGLAVFDRCFGSFNNSPTEVGNAVCNAGQNFAKATTELGSNSQKFVQTVDRDWRDLVRVATQNAIDRDAVQALQGVNEAFKEVEADLKSFQRDPDCGSQAAVQLLQKRFEEAGKALGDAGKLADLSGKAIRELGPVLIESRKILDELERMRTLISSKGSATKTQFDKLVKAISDLRREVEALAALDVANTIKAGSDLVTGVGPFATSCAGCAASLYVAIGSLASGTAVSTGGGVACPETGVGCAVTAVAVPSSLVTSTVAEKLGEAACQNAMNDLDKLESYYQTINKFVEAAAKLATGIPKSVNQAILASEALVALARELGQEGRQSLTLIQGSLNAMAPALESASDTVEDQMVPIVSRLGGNFLSNFGKDVERLGKCYDKLQALTASMGKDFYDGFAKFGQGLTHAVDASKVVSNLQREGMDAMAAATGAVNVEWRKANKDHSDFYKKVFGVDPGEVNVAKSIATMLGLAGSFATDGAALKSFVTQVADLLKLDAHIVSRSLDAGKRAFLNQDRLVTQSHDEYKKAKTASIAARIELAKAKSAAASEKRIALSQKRRVEFGKVALPTTVQNPTIVKGQKLRLQRIANL